MITHENQLETMKKHQFTLENHENWTKLVKTHNIET